jgi:hypothetical protein
VRDWLSGIPVVPLAAVVAVPAGSVVPALDAHPSRFAARQLVQLHVEPASPRVTVAVAFWNKRLTLDIIISNIPTAWAHAFFWTSHCVKTTQRNI